MEVVEIEIMVAVIVGPEYSVEFEKLFVPERHSNSGPVVIVTDVLAIGLESVTQFEIVVEVGVVSSACLLWHYTC